MLVVRTVGWIAVIIWYWHINSATTRTQCDAEAGVIVNRVAEKDPFRVIASKSCDTDTVEGVKRDNVAFACTGPTDYSIAR